MRYLSEIKVGVITLISLVLLGWIVFSLGKISLKQESYEVKVVFDKIAGLQEKDSVRLAGVEVGEISKIFLRRDNKVNVTLRLKKDLKVKKNSLFIITTESLLGIEKYVEIIPQEGEAKFLRSGGIIRGQTPIEAREIIAGIKETLDGVKDFGDSLKRLTGDKELAHAFKEIIDNFSLTSKEIYQLTSNLNKMVGESSPDIKILISDLKQTSSNIKNASSKVKDLLGDKRVDSDIRQIIHSLREASERIDNITKKFEEEILDKETTKNLKTTLRETKKAISSANRTLERLKQTKTESELEVIHKTEKNKWQTNLNLKVIPPQSKWFYQTGINDLTEGNKFNLQVGQKVDGERSLRLGVKEGKLGLGVDYKNKKLEVFGDLINPNDPYFDLKAGYKIHPYLHFIWGIEDAFDKKDGWVGISAVHGP